MLVIKDYIKVVNIDDLLRIILKVKGIEFRVSLSEAQLNLILAVITYLTKAKQIFKTVSNNCHTYYIKI